MNIEDKTIVITGGLSGLGKAVAEHFSTMGAKVAILDHANNDETLPEGWRVYQVDVTQRQDIANALDDIIDIWGSIDISVNCAGIAPAKKLLNRDKQAMPLEDFQQVIDVNLIGTFNMCALVAEKMANNLPDKSTQERGVIINTASTAAYEGQKGQCAYAASKGAIVSMTLPLARELASHGIRVVAIAPGVMGTPMMLAMPEWVQQGLAESIPFPRRMGLPEEYATLAAHIVSNPYMNGEVVRLDGALRMQ